MSQNNECNASHCKKNMIVGIGQVPCDILILGDYPSGVDCIVGKCFTGIIGKCLDDLIKDSKLNKFSIHKNNIVMCGIKNDDLHKSILNCMQKVNILIDECNPKKIIFLGDVTKKHYEKIYPQSFFVTHPREITKLGAQRSYHYLKTVRLLEEAVYGI